jgi:hypothetical protein
MKNIGKSHDCPAIETSPNRQFPHFLVYHYYRLLIKERPFTFTDPKRKIPTRRTSRPSLAPAPQHNKTRAKTPD